jgi:hypothetical protein
MTRGRDEIDSELRLLAALRRTVAGEGGGPPPDIGVVDELLDERRLSEQGDAADTDDKQDKVGSNGGA